MLVLDASVAVKWFFLEEPLRDQALAVRLDLIHNPKRFAVPPLFYSEVLHVLSKKSKQDLRFVEQAQGLIWRLSIPTIPLTDRGFKEAARFACDGVSGYDATYLALALELNAKWVTADVQAVKKSNGSAIFLGDY